MTKLDVARFHVGNGPAALFERLMQVFAQPRRSTELLQRPSFRAQRAVQAGPPVDVTPPS